MKNSFSIPLVAVVILTLFVFGILHWTDLPMSYFLDWLIGVGLFWWLLLITTVPWNLHFRAKEVLSDASDSENAGIEVEQRDVNYAQKISKTYLVVAILLHILSAIGLYFLASTGVSTLGYIGSILALLLTALRPSVRFYEYLNYRLSRMKNRIKYPREDILEVQAKLSTLKNEVGKLIGKLDIENGSSWARQKESEIIALREDFREMRLQFEGLNTQTQTQHLDLVKQTESKISLLSEDAQFLNQVRQLVRFVKEA